MSQEPDRLQRTFHDICGDYFPSWRAGRHWSIVAGPRATWGDADGRTYGTSEMAHCDHTTRTISVNAGSETTDLSLVIIHEISHAVTGSGHGKAFCARLRQAAQRATALGDTTLSTQLVEEADAYAEQIPYGSEGTRRAVYGRIADILRDSPGATLPQLVRYLAHELAFTVPEMYESYPRLQTVYAHTRQRVMAVLRRDIIALLTRSRPLADPIMSHYSQRLQALESVDEAASPSTKSVITRVQQISAVEDGSVSALMMAWRKASPDARATFRRWVNEQPLEEAGIVPESDKTPRYAAEIARICSADAASVG